MGRNGCHGRARSTGGGVNAGREPSWPGQKREARLHVKCPRHPRLSCRGEPRTWIPGTSPDMTNERVQGTTMNQPANQPASAYFLEDRHDPNETHTLSILVQNEPGVLARVIGLFCGRGYNIDSLTVSETESQKHLSRITIVTTGTPMVIEQIKHQLDRMIPVFRVVDMT